MIEGVTGTFQKIDVFLAACGVPRQVLADARGSYGGRLGFLQRVLVALDEEHPDRLNRVLEELASELERRDHTGEFDQLATALNERGFQLTDDGKVRPLEILPEETQQISDYLDDLISGNSEYLTIEILQHHLEQHRSLYSQGTEVDPISWTG